MERVALVAPDSHRGDDAGGGHTRRKLPFRSVNVPGRAGYRAGMQRHHLLPRQLLSQRALAALFDALGEDRLGFDDFRRNGLLLPSTDGCSRMLGLPLHRGPHRAYNEMVAERVGQIEAGWAGWRGRCSESAGIEALMRFGLLQGALRRRLLDARRRPFPLNARDPLGHGIDFTELDAMADALWKDTSSASG